MDEYEAGFDMGEGTIVKRRSDGKLSIAGPFDVPLGALTREVVAGERVSSGDGLTLLEVDG